MYLFLRPVYNLQAEDPALRSEHQRGFLVQGQLRSQGLLAVLPLFFALFVNFGIMGFLDVPLDAATAITACVAIGIGIDYGLHYLNRYRLLRGEGKDHKTAAMETAKTTGGAILINSFAVAAGFLVLVLSAFVPLVNLGILIATTMLTSALAALTLLPAALAIADKYKLIKS